MASEKQKRFRLIVFFFLGVILFNYPVLSLFSDAKQGLLGIPLLYAYVFTIWALLIVLTFITVRTRRKQYSHRSGKAP